MATATAGSLGTKEVLYEWEGKDRKGNVVRGEIRSGGVAHVQATLRRQGIVASKIKPRRLRSGRRIRPRDIAVFTRQLATMMKAGVPLLQALQPTGL